MFSLNSTQLNSTLRNETNLKVKAKMECDLLYYNNIVFFEQLVNAGADPNIIVGKTRPIPILTHMTMYWRAVMEGSLVYTERAIKVLLDAGAYPNAVAPDDDFTPLMYSARTSAKIVTLLLNAGANPNYQSEGEGKTALMNVSMGGEYLEIMELLCKAGANLDLQDKNGNTALMNQAIEGNVFVVAKLIQLGANQGIRNKKGETYRDLLNIRKRE